ncbi:MAG: chromosome segregation protein SMC [Deferrisomatales bacterium]
MKLKKLEISGFKTFPEPTELVFHDGITAIVGPNGCGKSNVIDAIRWVMGEMSAKGLRGDSMEDVIFAGSDSRKPLGLAEVTLTLSDVEGALPDKFGTYHEVAITRRLHRSGVSEYLINKIPCRLRDITELFMDTGVGRRAYSVVEQGRIDAILSAKPKDRRFLIEEAAGITKYKARKDETVRKMEHTSQNLQRLADVIGEVRREMNSLKRQAARAEAFKKLRAEKKALERDLMVAAWQDLAGRLDAARGEVRALETGLVAARAEAERLAATLEEGRLALLDRERELEAKQRGVYHLKNQISQREGRLEFLAQEVDSLEERARRAREEAGELEARHGALVAEIEGLEAELDQVEARMEARADRGDTLQGDYEEAVQAQTEAERALDGQKRALMAALGEATRVNHGLDHALRQEAEASRRLEGMGRQEAELRSKLGELGEEIALREADLVRAEEACELARQDRVRLEEELKAARSRRHRLAGEAEAARKALHTDQSRLAGLEQIKESLEGYGAGVRSILQEARRNGGNGVRGVVADTISAPAEYESALEAALGERLQYVIVEEPCRGLEAVRHLKSRKAGRSSFAPVNVRQVRPAEFPSCRESWARGPLLDLVEVAPEYEALARGLLGDVFVVETLEHALGLWERNGIRATLVTLEGETVSPEGVISGGAGGADTAGLLRKNREIRELREAVARRAAELQGLEAALEEVTEQAEDREGRLEAAREEVHRRELQVLHVTKDLAQLRERRERLDERLEALEFERDDLTEGIERLTRQVASLEQERARSLALQEELGAKVEGLEETLEGARERVAALHATLTRHKVEEASDRQRREGLQERLRTLRTSVDNVTGRRERLGREAGECLEQRARRVEERQRVGRETEVLRTELEKEERALAELGEGLDASRGELTAGERATAEARRRAEEAQRRFHEAELGLRDLELRAQSLGERFRERLGGELAQAARDGIPEGFAPEAAEERIRELDSKLEGFGEINLLAIEEYEERKSRYEFLEAQKADLEKSLANLKQAIGRINRVSRERFAETFEKVSVTFREIYPKLFRGGEARLLLTDPEDLLETGVDIIARPPGKRPQHISLLSGGEKAMTAVALIFSVFLVKPSPFCILDEVDAPLDEANVGRFSEMVKHMSASSQFLIITHNKSTMEAADHLYGVTMAEPGISKVVSVRLTDHTPARAA